MGGKLIAIFDNFIILDGTITLVKVTGEPKIGALLRIDGRTKGKLRQTRNKRASNVVAVALQDSSCGECMVKLLGNSIQITEGNMLALPVIKEYVE